MFYSLRQFLFLFASFHIYIYVICLDLVFFFFICFRFFGYGFFVLFVFVFVYILFFVKQVKHMGVETALIYYDCFIVSFIVELFSLVFVDCFMFLFFNYFFHSKGRVISIYIVNVTLEEEETSKWI